MQIADEVSNGLVQGSGGFRMADEVRKVPVQTAGVRCGQQTQLRRVPVQKPPKIFQGVGDHT